MGREFEYHALHDDVRPDPYHYSCNRPAEFRCGGIDMARYDRHYTVSAIRAMIAISERRSHPFNPGNVGHAFRDHHGISDADVKGGTNPHSLFHSKQMRSRIPSTRRWPVRPTE
jgi:hypothetical protein